MQPVINASARAPHYFELNGRAFVPIGANFAFQRFLGSDDETSVFSAFESQFSKLAANGGNFARVWMGVPFFDIEPEKEGVFDEKRCGRVRKLAELAKKHGVWLKLTLGHFRDLNPSCVSEAFPGAASFLNVVHRPENGGSCLSMEDYLSSKDGRASFLRKLDKLSEAMRGVSNVMVWELWNEMGAVYAKPETWRAWTEFMLPETSKRFPQALAVQSLGSFDRPSGESGYSWLCSLPGNAFKQAHRYLDLGAEYEVCKGPMDVLCADAVKWLLAHGPEKPALLAESGAVEPNHSAPSLLYPKDSKGMLLHDILFAPFFSGSAGSGQCWHWDFLLEKNNLWWHFKSFADALAGVDPIAEGFQPFASQEGRLRLYELKGAKTSLIWCRDSLNTWKSELSDGVPPETLRGLKLRFKNAERVEAFSPWTSERVQLRANDGVVELPAFERSLVLKIMKA